MNCSIEFVHNSFHQDTAPRTHLILPYMTFLLSSFVMLFGSYALPLISLANGAVVFMAGVDIAMMLPAHEEECISLTSSVVGVSCLAWTVSLFVTRYYRVGFFTALALAISSYNALRPVPLPKVESFVILGLPLTAGWGGVLVSFFLGFWARGNITHPGRLVCSAHGANGVCSALPILLKTALSVNIETWHISIIYAFLFASSYFTQYVARTTAARPDIDYGLYL